jgi:hypothetical protein
MECRGHVPKLARLISPPVFSASLRKPRVPFQLIEALQFVPEFFVVRSLGEIGPALVDSLDGAAQ